MCICLGIGSPPKEPSSRMIDVLKQLTVLYVEPDAQSRIETLEVLQAISAKAIAAADGQEASSLFEVHRPNVLVSAQVLPDMRGYELAGALRALEPQLPCVLIDSVAEPENMLAALNITPKPAAYLIKPTDYKVLKNALEEAAQLLLRQGRCMVRVSSDALYCAVDGTLLRDGSVAALTQHERRLLDALIQRRGGWVHREQLLIHVYDDPDVASEAGLKNLVMRLRRKLGREAINTRYGVGYRLRMEPQHVLLPR